MKKYFIRIVLFVFGVFYTLPINATKWNWEEIQVEEKHFPEDFLWGTAVSEFQLSGAEHLPNSQWSAWENDGRTKGHVSGTAADQWSLYEQDIKLMQELGLNSFRFSVEWSRIETSEGVFDQEALEHYRDVCIALNDAGIKPMITLHHFSNPMWYQDKGGFEKEENIQNFVDFSAVVFDHLYDVCDLWCTINEPAVYAMMGYIVGDFPPGRTSMYQAGVVLRNMLVAHVEVYNTLKKIDSIGKSQIGLVHNYLVFEPYNSWNPILSIPCHYLTVNLHESVMNFMKDGTFKYHFPLLANISSKHEGASESYDFFGLNYYSRAVLATQWSLSEPITGICFDDEEMMDMPLGMYPEGFYEALMDVAKLGKPIYVTENGIADAADDRREKFIHQYLYALSKAVEDGCDVRGYYYWSLIDNFEWAEGWEMKFGLYALDLETKERTLRDGSKAYQDIVRKKQVS